MCTPIQLFRWMTWIKICIASSSSCCSITSSHLYYPILYDPYFEFLFWPISYLISLKGRSLQPILQPNTRGQSGHFGISLNLFKLSLFVQNAAGTPNLAFVCLVLMQKEWKMKERNEKNGMIQDNTSQVAHKEIYSIILSCACLSAISRNHRMFSCHNRVSKMWKIAVLTFTLWLVANWRLLRLYALSPNWQLRVMAPYSL